VVEFKLGKLCRSILEHERVETGCRVDVGVIKKQWSLS
jgi:hypothetical protein